jgi:putative SOS response-associated peptidase YedK
MNNEDVLRISQQRDDIYDWVVARFRYFMENDEIDNALCLADEFFEWMDPDQLDNEQTLFINEDELKERFLEITEG